MELPEVLRNGIEHLMEGCQINAMKEISATITYKYKNESGTGQRLITKNQDAKVYSVVRMPVTFSAVCSALSYAMEQTDPDIKTVLDAGAGTGAASWAVEELCCPEQITCIERESAMRDIGRELMNLGSDTLKQASWIDGDIITEKIQGSYDLVISSYMLNELSQERRAEVIEKLWNAAGKMLLIVEPGTIAGYEIIKEARKQLTSAGGHIAAPCPMENECPMMEGDWCHFTCRAARSRMHRILKEGEVPYEDEKFTYIAVMKEPVAQVPARVLRHPQVEKGRIGLTVCTKEGIKEVSVMKRNKKLFSQARKVKCGDQINLES